MDKARAKDKVKTWAESLCGYKSQTYVIKRLDIKTQTSANPERPTVQLDNSTIQQYQHGSPRHFR